jgi:hypothetical protein
MEALRLQGDADEEAIETLRIQDDADEVAAGALGTIRHVVLYSEPGATSDEEREDETSRSGSGAIDGMINTPGDSEKCAQPAPDLEVS